MKSYSTKDQLSQLNRDQLCQIFNNCIECIKQNGLFQSEESDNFRQDSLAVSLEVNVRTFSSARNAANSVKADKYVDWIWQMANIFKLAISEDLSVRIQTWNPANLLNELGGKLALNLVDVSTSMKEDFPNYSDIFDVKEIWEQRENAKVGMRERFIAIVGPNASYAGTLKHHPIPKREEAIQIIRKKIESKVASELIEEEIKRLTYLTQRNPEDYETQLMVLSKFSPELVIKEVTKLCGNPNAPSLVYEILAHFLKHRFLDVVINFNFDELLDNAISEELPNSEFKYIYSAGHCPKNLDELKIDNRLKQPIYIKCHGTISQPNSLRFTERKGFVIDEGIQRHISELMLGEVPNDALQSHLPINLIIFGFKMENHVFNKLIEKALDENPKKFTIWLFDDDPELEKFITKRFEGHVKTNKLEIRPIKIDSDHQLEQSLIGLWDFIHRSFKGPYKPRGIARHILVNHIFQKISPLDLNSGNQLREYYHDRFVLEICILLLLSNGVVHLSQISQSRAGKYFQKLKELSDGNQDEYILYNELRKLGLKIYEGFMYDTFLIEDKKVFNDADALIEYLRNKLSEKLTVDRQQFVTNKYKNDFKKFALDIRKRNLLMVNPAYTHPHDNLFSYITNQDILNTSLAWIYHYRKNIENNIDKWDLMLAISEEGRFLNGDIDDNKLKEKYFELILATFRIPELIKHSDEKLRKLNLLSERPLYRPWWLHNKHLVLLMKRKSVEYTGNWNEDWELIEGFFYEHPMLSRRVNPVKINHKKDLPKLLFIFAIYWHGAKKYSSDEESMPVLKSKSQLDAVIKEMLKPFEKFKRKEG
ncbi:MAG TPA: SIR2 family protein [Flavilitoribacter sp.]|nr:SIR2 family protein [Flavilitoribacter sp.]